MAKIAIVDYGMGNLRSVQQACENVAPDMEVRVTSDPQVILEATHVVFPGQGAMPDCMRELDARGLRQAILQSAASKPFLGICIGLQMLFEHSEEGDVQGLGVFRGNVRRFPRESMFDAMGNRLKVPHMGWNEAVQCIDHPLWAGIEKDARFYFVHSYYVAPADEAIVAAKTFYPAGFASAVARGNIFAVQFHPEKSQSAGLTLLRNFSKWDGNYHCDTQERKC